MRSFFSAITLIGCLLGGFFLIAGVMTDSAPRMAAFAATGIGFAVIPYVATRIFYMSDAKTASEKHHAAMIQAVQGQSHKLG